MKRVIAVLSVVLLAQVALAVTFNLNRGQFDAFAPQDALLAADLSVADRWTIEDDAGATVRLRKQGELWRLPELDDFPVSGQKVAQVIAELSALQKGWPVATTEEAAERFKVAPEAFERKLVFQQGDNVIATLYLGTSPGFRKIHARRDGENEVFAVPFNAFQASAKTDDWLDAEFLHLDEGNINTVQLPGVTLRRGADGLEVERLAANEQTVKDEADSVVRKLATLRVQDVLGTEPVVGVEPGETALEVALTLKDDTAVTYTFVKPDDGDHYVLKRSDSPYFMTVASFTVDELQAVTREALVATAAPEGDGDEGLAGTGENADTAGDLAAGSE